MDPPPKPVRYTTAAPVQACPACGCTGLFVRKDFPQKLGLALVISAAVAFLILAARPTTFYIGVWILAAAAVVDAMLHLLVRKLTVCYRCRAEIRGPVCPALAGYDLSVGEKYRMIRAAEWRDADDRASPDQAK